MSECNLFQYLAKSGSLSVKNSRLFNAGGEPLTGGRITAQSPSGHAFSVGLTSRVVAGNIAAVAIALTPVRESADVAKALSIPLDVFQTLGLLL